MQVYNLSRLYFIIKFLWEKTIIADFIASKHNLKILVLTKCNSILFEYSKTCLKQNLKGPKHFSAKARFPFNQGTLHIKN
jgi:hypothetical protein